MNPPLRIPAQLYHQLHADLDRQHPHASERVGFLFARPDVRHGEPRLLLATAYWSVPDAGYAIDPEVGARISEGTIREAMQRTFDGGYATFHVHKHHHAGRTFCSGTDKREQGQLMPCFRSVAPLVPHGALVISTDTVGGWYWTREGRSAPICTPIPRITVVGFPMKGFSP